MFIPRFPMHEDLSFNNNIEWNAEAIQLHEDPTWLEHALELDAFNSNSENLRALVNHIFDEMVERGFIESIRQKRKKQSLKSVLMNLWTGNLMGMPTRYSRDKNVYTRDGRYGKLFFKYSTIIPVIDALYSLKYIEQKKGRSFYEDKKRGRQSRIWATPELIMLFISYDLFLPDFIKKTETKELIVLRDNDKKEIGYVEDKNTKLYRNNIYRYNEFTNKHTIDVKINSNVNINNDFLISLYRNFLNNKVSIKLVKYTSIETQQLCNSYKHLPINKIRSNQLNRKCTNIHNNKQYTNTNYTTITQTFSRKPLTDGYSHRLNFHAKNTFISFLSSLNRIQSRKEKNNSNLLDKFPLEQIGIKELEFRLNQPSLHRVFNRSVFDKGGRAYGALYQNLPNQMRPYIYIDGQPTVEIDFSAYHILMLYHLEKIDYQDDPYSVCEGPEQRKIYKKVALPAVNAKDKNKAYGAIREEFKKKGIPLPAGEKPLVKLVSAFRDAHEPISKYLFSDIGITLQNIDSKIMDAILGSLMDKGILGLSVFDSVIVGKQYETVTKGVMIEEYEKVMGFKPLF